MREDYQIGSSVFGSWVIRRKIGEGSFGQVFAIERQDFGQTYTAALKVITVPQSEAEYRSTLGEGLTPEQASRYYYSVVEDIVKEFALMSKLKGTAHVVSYEDHAVLPHPNGAGWDILIRMELLSPLLTHAAAHPMTRRDVAQLGVDICHALELCQRYSIIHRDIKPENIFVSPYGDYKLGDFGIARTIDRTMSGLSKKGTFSYMAPEVYRGEAYGFTVDLYSLGVVLYRLLNRNRLPFLPPADEPITYTSREAAMARRMSGETPPPPCLSQDELGEIVCRAMAYHPKDRFSSPGEMRRRLEAILPGLDGREAVYPDTAAQAAGGQPPREAPPLQAAPTEYLWTTPISLREDATVPLQETTGQTAQPAAPVSPPPAQAPVQAPPVQTAPAQPPQGQAAPQPAAQRVPGQPVLNTPVQPIVAPVQAEARPPLLNLWLLLVATLMAGASNYVFFRGFLLSLPATADYYLYYIPLGILLGVEVRVLLTQSLLTRLMMIPANLLGASIVLSQLSDSSPNLLLFSASHSSAYLIFFLLSLIWIRRQARDSRLTAIWCTLLYLPFLLLYASGVTGIDSFLLSGLAPITLPALLLLLLFYGLTATCNTELWTR